VALQQHTTQLTDKYDHLSAEYAQLKASQAQQKAEYEQQKTAYEQLCEMVMNMVNSGTCAPNPFWPYNHQPPPPGISSSSSSSTFILICNKHYLPLKLNLIFFLKHIQFVMNII
jgi:hypothetical protein